MEKLKKETSGLTKTELREEILSRMNALDISGEEYSNQELLKEFERYTNNSFREIENEIVQRTKVDSNARKNLMDILHSIEEYLSLFEKEE